MEQPSASQRRLRVEQKVGFVLLLIFGIVAVVLGGLQLRNTIYGPFVVRLDTSERADIERLFNNEETRLQQIDTDKDGLNDFEELSFYETSPYLPDSDSDGLGDAQEVQEGTNPNCAQGTDCTTDAITQEKQETVKSPLLNVAPPEQAQGIGILRLQDLVNDPASLRKLLLDTGQVTQEELSTIDDEALRQLAQELLKEQQTATTSTVSGSVTSTAQ